MNRFLHTLWPLPLLLPVSGLAQAPAPFRVIFYSDTTNMLSCATPWHPNERLAEVSAEMVRAHVDEAADAGAEAFFLEPGLGWVPWWNGSVLPLAEHRAWYRRWTKNPAVDYNGFPRFVWQGGDFIKLTIDECHAKGIPVFISFRLNDGNNKSLTKNPLVPATARIDSVPQYYIEHQDYLLRPGGAAVPGWSPSSQFLQNFAIPAVVEMKFAQIRELCEQYDLDGLQLDFMRYPYFFLPDPGTTAAQRVQITTDLVRRVRQLLNQTARPGQHRQLGIRLPCYTADFAPMGIDVAAFAAAGADLFTISTFYEFEQQTDAARIRMLAPDKPFYQEITHTTTESGSYFRRATDSQIYTTAHLAYTRGFAGIALFNFQYYRKTAGAPADMGPWCEPPFRVVARLGDPAWLARQPQEYFLAAVRPEPAYRPASAYPLGDHGSHPLVLRSGAAKTLTLVTAAPADGWAAKGLLRLQTKAALRADTRLTVRLNGHRLVPSEQVAEYFPNPDPANLTGNSTTVRSWTVPSDELISGSNQLELALEPGGDPSVVPIFLALAMDTTAQGDFSLSTDTKSRFIMAGSNAVYDLNIGMVDGRFDGVVVFSVAGLPSGATGTFTAPAETGPRTGASVLKVATIVATPPGSYPVTVTATSGSQVHSVTAKLVISPVTPLPAAPRGLEADGGDRRVTLRWQAVDGAAGYRIKSSRISGRGYETVATSAINRAEIGLLAPDSTYYYVISAVNAAGESADSAAGSATTRDGPR